ncbi:MAG: hemin uptake protein HemP [Pseudomonadota bacterium]
MSDMKQAPNGNEGAPKPRPTQSAKGLRTYRSQDLFEDDSTIGIEHGGALYQLKITRQGKLILNK